MAKADLDKHKFDTRWRIIALVILLIFAAYLQFVNSTMASEFISLIIGLIGGGAATKTIVG
jgi:hypothetical protein